MPSAWLADIAVMTPWLTRLDDQLAAQPMLARALPYLVYVLLLTLVAAATQWQGWLYPPLYAMQCVLVAWLLWRYRHLTPELTIRFHWLAIPVGVLVAALWLGLGKGMVHLWPEQFGAKEPHYFEEMQPGVRWASLTLRVLGMSILVPMFEELFIRSLLLRCLHSAKKTGIGLVQLGCDLPLVGDYLMQTRWAAQAEQHGPVFSRQFEMTPLGRLSVFGVLASTFLFMLGHGLRDWPGCIACGVLYCVLLGLTAKKGLGPVIWAHGITNALLFAYSLKTGDWQFL